jgi:tRNA pseudouridine13 synthase
VSLHYLGQIEHAYTSQDILANRFRVTLRDLKPDDADAATVAVDDVRRDGLPNYFDDQRFGSMAGAGGDFIGRHLVRGEYEAALKLALAGPYEFDRAEAKREKQILRDCWGRWAECKGRLPRGHARSLVDYLVHHPADFRGAVARLRPELQGMYLSAYQSYLWNAIVAAWLSDEFAAEELRPVRLRLGAVPVPRRLDDTRREQWQARRLPLPAARWPMDANAPWAAAAARVLAGEALTWDQLKLKGLRKPFFTKGERDVWCLPADFGLESGPDERHAGRVKLVLAFTLPRGSYATRVVKRLTA